MELPYSLGKKPLRNYAIPSAESKSMMASQKLTNCCVAAIALVTAAYLSTPHSSTIARLAFGAFCLAIHSFCFLAKANRWKEGRSGSEHFVRKDRENLGGGGLCEGWFGMKNFFDLTFSLAAIVLVLPLLD